MQFTILSHAGIVLEHGGVRIVCDPWLIGSCYWRSWWNFPEPPAELIADLKPDYIYLTHLHWDHFHGPSLQKLFSPATPILVPKVPTRRMLNDLQWLGFRNVEEIPHGKQVQLGKDFTLRSYQFGPAVDSAVVLSGGGCNVFNCNDAKLFGLPLQQVMRDFPKIDFILRSHSSASPVPFCVEDYQTLLPVGGGEYDSADQFARCALYVGARYAVPFASNHCFLHQETVRFNETATTPEDVKRRYHLLASRTETRQTGDCVVMPPGSRWNDTEGFFISPFDFAERSRYIELLQARHQLKLAASYVEEASTNLDVAAFRTYFGGLLNALPWLLRRRWLGPVVFRSQDPEGTHLLLVDPRHARIEVVSELPADCVRIDVHPKVLNDCVTLKMFSVWSASKRLKIHLPSAAHLGVLSHWLTVLDLYEVDMLPLYRNLTPRALGVRLRRWREAVEVARIIWRRIVLRRPFSVEQAYSLPDRPSPAPSH
jgi:UDP-MurNAc hydroxylase